MSNKVKLSLLARSGGLTENLLGMITVKGDVHSGAGLNWGFSNALPAPMDAYISIPVSLIKDNLDFFASKDKDERIIEIIWDDGTEMLASLEGSQNVLGKKYPKQISSHPHKCDLGRYLRRRIGEYIQEDLVFPEGLSKVELEENPHKYAEKFILKEQLLKYGRTDITVFKIGPSRYFFDFSND